MIITELYNGQGLGNQLWCYAVTRVIAEKNNYTYGIMSPEKFKGREFMDIDFGNKVVGGHGPEGGPPTSLPDGIANYYKEKMVWHQLYRFLDITPKDDTMLSIQDNTKIDGCMQSYEYLKQDLEKVKSWFNVRPSSGYDKFTDDDVCIIHVRGGDVRGHYTMVNSEYYYRAMNYFKSINPNIKFYALTDDIAATQNMIPGIEIVGATITNEQDSTKANHHIGGPIAIDFNILYNAKNLIIPASSFSWWAAWLNKNKPKVIAPKYWAAHNQSDSFWSCGEMQVDMWNYMDRHGVVS
jgi:hypothetical protein